MRQCTVTFWLAACATVALAGNVARADELPSNTATASAQSGRDDLNYTPPTWPDAPDTAAMLRRLVLGTATVLGLCVCTLWIGRRWLRGAPRGATSGSRLRLVETVVLGNRCSVHLLQTGDHQVLVGIDGTGLKSLVPLPASFENTLAEIKPAALDGVVALAEETIAS
jgi:flagellar biogenesis protein FliO